MIFTWNLSYEGIQKVRSSRGEGVREEGHWKANKNEQKRGRRKGVLACVYIH